MPRTRFLPPSARVCCEQLRIGRQVVVGGEQFEAFTHGEADDVLGGGIGAGHAVHGFTGKLRGRDERLREHVERKLRPRRVGEAIRIRRACGLRRDGFVLRLQGAAGELGERDRLLDRRLRELRLASGSQREPRHDVPPGAAERLR